MIDKDIIDIIDFKNKRKAITVQNDDIKKDLSLNRKNIEDLVFDETKPYNIDFCGMKSDDRYRIIIDFKGFIKTKDGKYSYNYNFIYCAPKVIESEERVIRLIELLKKEYRTKIDFSIENRPFIEILDDEIKNEIKGEVKEEIDDDEIKQGL